MLIRRTLSSGDLSSISQRPLLRRPASNSNLGHFVSPQHLRSLSVSRLTSPIPSSPGSHDLRYSPISVKFLDLGPEFKRKKEPRSCERGAAAASASEACANRSSPPAKYYFHATTDTNMPEILRSGQLMSHTSPSRMQPAVYVATHPQLGYGENVFVIKAQFIQDGGYKKTHFSDDDIQIQEAGIPLIPKAIKYIVISDSLFHTWVTEKFSREAVGITKKPNSVLTYNEILMIPFKLFNNKKEADIEEIDIEEFTKRYFGYSLSKEDRLFMHFTHG